jgi:hypothetical protein
MSLSTASLARSAASTPSFDGDDRTSKKEEEPIKSLHRIACWLGGAPSMTKAARPGSGGKALKRHSRDEVGGLRLD